MSDPADISTPAPPVSQSHSEKSPGLWKDAARRLLRNKIAMASLVVVVVYVLIALGVLIGSEGPTFAAWLAPASKAQAVAKHTESIVGWLAPNWDQKVVPEGEANYQPPSWEYWFGTDFFGQSVFRKTLIGAKISLTVAFFAAVISICIGVPIGAVAGFFGGVVDELVVWLYATLSSIPGFLLILAFAVALQDVSIFGVALTGLPAVFLALGLTSWVGICRLIRGEVIKHKNRDYVTAAKAYGAKQPRIIFRHVLPNVTHLILIDFSVRFVGFIQAEVILSYLGLGPKNQPSWGVMINAARQELSRDVWWQLAAATFAVMVICLALNLLGDALRDALDPKIVE